MGEVELVRRASFYPLVEKKLRLMGRVHSTYTRKKRNGFVPDFVVEDEEGRKWAVDVDFEFRRERLIPTLLSRKAFRILVHLRKFDKVLYIAPYQTLKALCNVLRLVNVKPGERFQTADLAYMVEFESLDVRLGRMLREVEKVKRALKSLEYAV